VVLEDIFVGRQPIYDRSLGCIAYELLYRSGDATQARVQDGTQATSKVVLNSVLDIGLENLVGERLAFINLNRQFLLSGQCSLIPPARGVLEILEDVTVDERVVRAVRQLRGRGYRIALDDFVWHEHLLPLVELADIVKVDLPQLSDRQLARHVERLRPYPVKLLAEKVETREQFRRCLKLGFEYFQGFFLCRPEVVKGQQVSPSRLAALRLLARLQDPHVDLREVGELVSHDVSLAHRLMRVIHSAGVCLPHKVASVGEAVLLLGTQFVAKLASLVILAQLDNQPAELITTATVRARMCELLGKAAGGESPDTFFLVGLFSMLDAILGLSLEAAIRQLPLAEKVQAALLANQGTLGGILACVVAFERGDWEAVERSGLDPTTIQQTYLQAIAWAAEMTGHIA